MAKPWTSEQITYFESSWGNKSLKTISKNLGKNEKAVDAWRKRHGYETNTKSHHGIPVHEFAEAMGVCPETIYDYWIKKGLPVIKFLPGTRLSKIMINLDLFWPWAKLNRKFIDFSKVEKNALGKEPEWVEECRKYDFYDRGKKGWERPWTKEEEDRLVAYLMTMRYTFRQLATLLNRTELGIQNRLYIIGVKYRPLPETRREWTLEETEKLIAMVKSNISTTTIANLLDRNQISIKTKVQRLKARGILVHEK
ncbi:MAG: hypothetical protein NC238_02910 [Dehalobacter sp.]|nr:hypothetical protein [Dehalobacter sp.]